jgi:hypothetical protein
MLRTPPKSPFVVVSALLILIIVINIAGNGSGDEGDTGEA